MKKAVLFRLQLTLTSLAYNHAFMSLVETTKRATPRKAILTTARRPISVLVVNNSNNNNPGEPTNGSLKNGLKEPIEIDDAESILSHGCEDREIMNQTQIEDNTVIDEVSDDNEEEEVQIQIDQKMSKEDLLANTSSISSPLSISSRSEELLEIIGEDIFNKVNSSQQYFESSPPLSFSKYLTMQVHQCNGGYFVLRFFILIIIIILRSAFAC